MPTIPYDLRRKGAVNVEINLQQAVRATPTTTIMPFSRNASDETGKALSSPRPPNVQIGRLFPWIPGPFFFVFLLVALYANANK